MKQLYIFIILVITILSSGCSSSLYEEKVLTNEQWLEDIDALDNNLRDYHSEVFRFISEEEWKKNIESLKSDVENLSDSHIKLRIAQIVSSVEDAHTTIIPSELVSPVPSPIPKQQNPTDIKYVIEFPIKCDYFDDGVRVIESDSEYKEILGYKLISINGVDVNTVLNHISTLMGNDYGNRQIGLAYAKDLMNSYEILSFFNVVDSNKAEYVIEDDNNEKIQLQLKAVKNENIDYISANKKDMKTNIMPEGENKLYWYNGFEEDEVLYFKFNSFVTSLDDDKYPNFYDFIDELLKEMNSNKYNKLVIDLRDNGGGRSNLGYALIEGIKLKTDLSGEDIYLITGKKTGSAAVILAYEMQSKMNVKVVGEETGGNVNLFGAGGQFELPNSKLKPIIGSNLKINKEGYNGGVKPDIEIKQNYDDYINGIDTCYEYIKNIND